MSVFWFRLVGGLLHGRLSRLTAFVLDLHSKQYFCSTKVQILLCLSCYSWSRRYRRCRRSGHEWLLRLKSLNSMKAGSNLSTELQVRPAEKSSSTTFPTSVQSLRCHIFLVFTRYVCLMELCRENNVLSSRAIAPVLGRFCRIVLRPKCQVDWQQSNSSQRMARVYAVDSTHRMREGGRVCKSHVFEIREPRDRRHIMPVLAPSLGSPPHANKSTNLIVVYALIGRGQSGLPSRWPTSGLLLQGWEVIAVHGRSLGAMQ